MKLCMSERCKKLKTFIMDKYKYIVYIFFLLPLFLFYCIENKNTQLIRDTLYNQYVEFVSYNTKTYIAHAEKYHNFDNVKYFVRVADLNLGIHSKILDEDLEQVKINKSLDDYNLMSETTTFNYVEFDFNYISKQEKLYQDIINANANIIKDNIANKNYNFTIKGNGARVTIIVHPYKYNKQTYYVVVALDRTLIKENLPLDDIYTISLLQLLLFIIVVVYGLYRYLDTQAYINEQQEKLNELKNKHKREVK